MTEIAANFVEQSILVNGTDIEVFVRLEKESMIIDVKKSGVCVHTVIIDHAADSLEHGWLADLFAREDYVGLRHLAKDMDAYLISSNINQG